MKKNTYIIFIIFLFLQIYPPHHFNALAQENTQKIELYKQEFVDAYDFANRGDFVKAIEAMQKISRQSPYFTKAQDKIAEWKAILKAKGTSFEKELERPLFNQALKFQSQGYLVRSIYLLQQFSSNSPFYQEAQTKVSQIKNQLSDMKLDYETALNQYKIEYEKAVELLEQSDYESALNIFNSITEGSPFYDVTEQVHIPLAKKLVKDAQNTSQQATQPHPKHNSFELSLIPRATLPLGGEHVPGGGIGLTYFINTSMGIHLEGDVFMAQNFSSYFIPITFRYYFRQNVWSPYIGGGGFLSLVSDESETFQLPVGGILETGVDYKLNENMSIGVELNYGVTFSPTLSHTFGGGAAYKFGF